MFLQYLSFRKPLQSLVLGSVVLLLMAVQPLTAAAMSPQESRTAIHQTISALWTGATISPALEKKQTALKSMLESGALSKSDLKEMVGTAVMKLMGEKKTTRYMFNQIAEPFNALFSPHLEWEAVKEIIWSKSSAPVDDQVVITIGTLAPPGTPYLSVPRTTINPRINKLTNGKIKVKIYGGGVMGEDTDILRKMDIGQLTGCGSTALGVLKAAPNMSVFTTPGLFNSYDEIDYIFKKFRKRIDEEFEKRGYMLAALIDTGFFHIYSKKKFTDLDDIRHRKMLTWMGEVETTLFNELNINPTPVAVPEVISALSTGLADTNLAPAVWMLGMQGYQYANYFTETPLLYSPAAVIVSSSFKDKLQKEIGVSDLFAHNLKEFILSEYNVIETMWREKIRTYERKAMAAFQQKCGMKPVSFPEKDRKAIEKANIAVREKLAGNAYPRQLMEEVLNALAEYRKNQQ
ncbi:MAG: TRAP transporter substrate-binding protein DctP [Thermodesulfobacteriota bacterium]|nr:TRAP transporter substrate-binding protein DctP [Thermodesulfobacteriota bacterium]